MKSLIACAADTILEITLRMHTRVQRETTAQVLTGMRDVLVEEFGCSPGRATEEVRAAMLRRAANSPRPELQRIASLYHAQGRT